MNALMNFASESKTIVKVIQDMLKVTPLAPNTYRLSVATAFDKEQPIEGMFSLEAPVMLELINTAYAEIASAANRETRSNASIPVADRGRSLSGYDDQYDGAENPELTDDDLENDIDKAIDRAAIILGYATHIANIKDGGAEWLKGFEADKWIAKDAKDEAAVLKCQLPGADLTDMIKEQRVIRVREHIKNRLVSFNEWIETQLKREATDSSWKMKLAYARVQNIMIEHADVSTAKDYIGQIVLGSAFNRDTTRLEDAISRVANRKYLRLAYALNDGRKSEITSAFKAAYPSLCYSSMLLSDIKDLHDSAEWQDHQLQLEVDAAKRDAEQELRNAIRAQTMFGIEKQAQQIAGIRAQAAGILAMIKKEKNTLSETEKEAKAAKKATKAVTKAKTVKASPAKTSAVRAKTKGIAGTDIAFAK